MRAPPHTVPLLCLALGLALLPRRAAAGGFTLTSFGDRRGGMLSNLGRPDDLTALVHNPAGLADQPGQQAYLFLSPTFLTFQLQMQAIDPQRFPGLNPRGCGQGGAAACPWPVGPDGYYQQRITPERYFGLLPYLGVATDLGFLSPRARDVVLSLAVYAPNFYGAYFPEDAPTAYGFIEGTFLVTAVTLGVGYRVTPGLAVGGRLSYNYMTLSMDRKLSTTDLLTAPGQPPDILATVAQQALGDLRFAFAGTDHGVGWGLGLLLSPEDWLDIGLAYEGSSAARFTGDVSFSAPDQPLLDQREFEGLVSSLGFKLPQQLTVQMIIPHALSAGFNAEVTDRVELGVDLRVWLYNLYDRQVVTPHYDPAAPGTEPIDEDALSSDKGYHLSYQLTAGVLVRPWRRLPRLELMAGVGYDHSPIPDETLTLDNPSLSQVKASCGVRWGIDRHWRVLLTYMAVAYLRRDITTSKTNPPNNIRGEGATHSPAAAVNYTF